MLYSTTTHETDLPTEVSTALLRRLANVEVLPAIAARALEIARNPDSSIREFSRVVEQDVVLASDILRMANSSIYGLRTPVSDIHQAVFRLGFRQCKNLILSSCMSSLMRRPDLSEEWSRAILARHGMTTAVAALHLNRSLNLGFHGEEFTAGLVHDMGRTLLAMSMPDQFATFDMLSFEEDDTTLQAEQAAIGTDHTEVGAWVFQRYSLPSELVDVVRFHHSDARSAQYADLVALVQMADALANHIQRQLGDDALDVTTIPGVAQYVEVRGPAFTTMLQEMAPAIMEHAVQDVSDSIFTAAC